MSSGWWANWRRNSKRRCAEILPERENLPVAGRFAVSLWRGLWSKLWLQGCWGQSAMAESIETESRKLLGRVRDTMAGDDPGQARLDKITHLIADSIGCEVCSIYLFRDEETLELCATEGLNPDAVHQTRMRLGEGLVGRVARRREVVNTADAPNARGFRFMPETGEEVYSSLLGVPIQRLGESLGVLVVQSKQAREFSADEVYALEVVAMVLAEMTELGAFVGDGAAMGARHSQPAMLRGTVAQEGVAEGHIWLHEPRVVVTIPIADDPLRELARLKEGVEELRVGVDAADGGRHQPRAQRRGGGGEGAIAGARAHRAGHRQLFARAVERAG